MNTENTKETEVAPCGAEAFKKISDDGQKIWAHPTLRVMRQS